jgi:predicted alpha/beta superfamily hydrolase
MNQFQEDSSYAPIPKVLKGRIERLENFKSAYLSPRHIDVWLPEDYPSNGEYVVLYMNDGQMLFDGAITWNKQSWGVAEIVAELSSTGKISHCIVVGIWNSGGSRHSEYFPQKPFENLPVAYREFLKQAKREDETPLFTTDIRSDNYLKFITEELKPFIDRRYATLPNVQSTFIAGSSMGGLISIYAICEYPEVFGGAACLSTHWIGALPDENNPIPDVFIEYLRQNLPNPNNHRIYFDYGTETLDAFYEPYQLKVDQVMIGKGYSSANWQTRKFAGEEHSEGAWRKRLHIPISFLLRS